MRPRFEITTPKTKEEKLIVELVTELDKVTLAFVRKHCPGNLTEQMFMILRDAALAYMSSMLWDLIKSLALKEQKGLFVDEAEAIFKCYMEDLRKRYETHH